MKIHRDIAQGSQDWFAARRGIPTASEFHLVVTPTRGDLSKSARKYAYRLLAERLLNFTTQTLEGQHWIERGKDLEPMAVNQFELVLGIETEPVGLIVTDDGALAASPDRLVIGRPEAVEIKCPAPHTHIGYLLDGPSDDYRPQVQGQLLVGKLELVHFYSYSERMPPCLVSTPRDEPYIEKLSTTLGQFGEMLAQLEERARSLGMFSAFEDLGATPTDVERGNELRDMDAALREG